MNAVFIAHMKNSGIFHVLLAKNHSGVVFIGRAVHFFFSFLDRECFWCIVALMTFTVDWALKANLLTHYTTSRALHCRIDVSLV